MIRTFWPWLLAGLVLAGYVVPYGLLSGVERWHGAFLFWIVFGLAIWIVLSLAVLSWTPDAWSPDADPDRDATGERP